MRINTNISALNAWKNLSVTGNQMAKSLEKLSSGYRINKAADDAAGLAISEKMRAQTSGLNQAQRNAQDGISMIQTAEGALNESHAILQRMRELTVQAGNGTNKLEDLQKIQEEVVQLQTELSGIGDRTQFNGQNLLDGGLGATTANVDSALTGAGAAVLKIVDVTGAAVGANYTVTSSAGGGAGTINLRSADGLVTQSLDVADTAAVTVGDRFYFDKLGVTLEAVSTSIAAIAANNTFDVTANGVSFQIGANGGQTLAVSISDMRADQLGSAGIKMDDIDVTDFTVNTFDQQLAAIDAAISTVSSERSKLGAWQNRLDHTINNLTTASENLTAAASRIRDVDMALEMANFTRTQILQQAGTAMLAQANASTQSVLKLLG